MRSLTFSGSKTVLIKMYSGLYQEYIISYCKILYTLVFMYLSPAKLFCLHDHTLASRLDHTLARPRGFIMASAWSLCVCGEVQKIFGVLVKEVCL